MTTFKRLAMTGLLGAAALTAGCSDRDQAKAESDAKGVGRRDIGKAARDVGETVKDVGEGFKEGVGGSGKEGVDIGKNPGVLDDGEGPLENPETRPGRNPGVINDGEGPIEERRR
jgi:hypothetical protein